MKIIYRVSVSCGRNRASLDNSYESKEIPNIDTKYQIAKGYFLCPKEVCVGIGRSVMVVRFEKRFWFWQRSKFNKFIATVENKIPL